MQRNRATILAAAVFAATFMVAGCNRPNSTQTSSAEPSDTTASKSDIAANTSRSAVNPPSDTAANSSSSKAPIDSSSSTANAPASSAPSDNSATAQSSSPDTSSNAMVAAASGSDAAITAKVNQALQADPSLKAMNINVDTKNGKVTLSGTVDTNEMRMHAHQIAASTSGVAGVVDNLTVKNTG